MKNSFFREFAVTLAVFLLLTVPFLVWDIDIVLQKMFYSDGEWVFKNHAFWVFLYDYGPVPALGISIIALLMWLVSAFTGFQKQNRRVFAFVALLMVFGPGLVVNAVFKEYWGRPRPREIVEFGGQRAFVPPLVKGEFVSSRKYEKMLESSQGAVEWDILRNLYRIKGRYNSFPNGHASVGFFMIFPYFLYRNRKQALAMVWLIGGSCYGVLMGIGRMAQGGHFASDFLWSGAMVYLVGLGLYYALHIYDQDFSFRGFIAGFSPKRAPF
ncbi:MAG: phosphatase PAP2 family protein [Chlorobiales bacterium]|nr:phosphatase PAP2 family protein [Chlorobiales bacterium]